MMVILLLTITATINQQRLQQDFMDSKDSAIILTLTEEWVAMLGMEFQDQAFK